MMRRRIRREEQQPELAAQRRQIAERPNVPPIARTPAACPVRHGNSPCSYRRLSDGTRVCISCNRTHPEDALLEHPPGCQCEPCTELRIAAGWKGRP